MDKKQNEFKERYANIPPGKLTKEDDVVLSDMQNIFNEFMVKLKKTNLLRSQYILSLSALAEQYRQHSADSSHEKVCSRD